MNLLVAAQVLLLCFLLLFFDLTKSNTLRQIHVLFRHGERSPTETYPNDVYKNYSWSGGWGQLTNRGKYQIYHLGKSLREVYKDFLPKYYQPETLQIFSSAADRCLMSAELFTAGLYPPQDQQIWNPYLLWQPIPVQYVPRLQDNYIAMKQPCDIYDKMLQDTFNSKKVADILSAHSELLKLLTEKTGMQVDTLGKVETLSNTLEIEQLNNLTLPTWANKTVMDTILQLGAQNLALYSETDYMKKMKGGVLLKRIKLSMDKITKNIAEPKILLYSGHDLTVVHVLRALNLVNTIKPDFGASIIFELHQEADDYYIKVIYRQSWEHNPSDLTEKACEASCSFKKFSEVLTATLPSNWDEECRTNS